MKAVTGQRDLEEAIIDEIYRAFVLLGADSELLAKVGSWRHSLPIEDVLLGIKAWNQATIAEVIGRIEHYEESCRRPVCIPDEAQRIVAEVQ
jgi:hypothetical protein